jgi:hypothetical protein
LPSSKTNLFLECGFEALTQENNMIHFLLSIFFNLISGCGTGLPTAKERDDLSQTIKATGKTGYIESDPDAWERHLAALNHPQPKEWRE